MNPSECYGVYAIICQVNGRVYIGRTEKSFSKRWSEHRNRLVRGLHRNRDLQVDWSAFGAGAFTFEILFAVDYWPPQYWVVEQKEREYIRQYAEVRYNIVDELNVNRNWAR